jgi:hypothetical protein
MKKFFFLLMAAFLIGFACFAIVYWVVKWNYNESISLALSIGISGLVVELLRPYIKKKSRDL